MNKILYTLFSVLILSYCASAATQAIYEEDNRKHIYDVPDDSCYTNSEYMQLSQSICLIVDKNKVHESGGTGTGNPVDYPLGGIYLDSYGKLEQLIYDQMHPGTGSEPVSSSIRFYGENVSAPGLLGFGTGVAVGQRQVLTVDHIFEDDQTGGSIDPSNFVAIFNWIDNDSLIGSRWHFSPYNYFRILGYEKTFAGDTLKKIRIAGSSDRLDLSIIRLDRILDKDIVALNIYNYDEPKAAIAGKELYMIGHCLGLPQIFTDKAYYNPNVSIIQADSITHGNLTEKGHSLTDAQYSRCVFANLDGFKGNSGSPVFVKDKNLDWRVMGIYRGGENDFKNDNGKIVESFYTKDEFTRGDSAECFETLQDLNFDPYCHSDCDYINFSKAGIKNPPIRGQPICIQLSNYKFLPGTYYVHYYGNNSRIAFYDIAGNPTPDHVCWTVPNGCAYNVTLNDPHGNIVYWFNKSGTATGTTLQKSAAFENDPVADGGDLSALNFIAKPQDGHIPLYATFRSLVPANKQVAIYTWQFGDGGTSDNICPTHKYIKPGVFAVSLAVKYTDNTTAAFTYPGCITVSGEVTSFRSVTSINSDVKLSMHDLNTAGQINSTTCTAKGGIVLYPKTIIKAGAPVILKAK